MNSNQKFFLDNYLMFAKELNKIGDKRLLELLKKQRINRDKLLTEISKILLDYNIKDNVLDVNNIDKIKIYSNMSKVIDKLLNNENKLESKELASILLTSGSDKWDIDNYLLCLGVDTKIQKVNKDTLLNIINKKIEGKNYSNRIWSNKNDVAKRLKQEIKNLYNGDTTVNEIKDKITKLYNTNANNTKRLVSNEIARVNESIHDKWLEENEYANYVMWCATLEDNTCEECGALDGKVWRKDDDYPTPLLHIGCRCTLVPLLDKDYRPSKRLDNITKENINWQTYQEWKDNN